jgi:protein SCO1
VFRRVGAGVALLAGLATGACGDDGPDELAGAVRTPALDVAGVSLPSVGDGAGEEPLAMQAPPGELYLVYFGYTSCPDVCPTTMNDIRVALDDLPDELADRVTPAMATVDPERDTGEVLTGYLDHFFDHGLALRTTDPAALTAATEAFGVQWEVEDHAPGEAYDVAHTAVTYVVDDTGTVAVEWPFGFDSESMTSDLRTLLEEEHT